MAVLVLFTVTLLVLGIAAYAYSPLTAAMIPQLVGGRLAGSAVLLDARDDCPHRTPAGERAGV